MLKNQYYQQLFKLVFATNLVFINSIPVTAQKVNSSTNRERTNTSQPNKKKPENRNNLNRKRYRQTPRRSTIRIKSVYFRPPQLQGTPQGTTPAGSRNSCAIAEKKPLSALVPLTKKADGRELRWGLTTKENPTFWFYVPHKLKSIKNPKFSLRNRQNQTIYEKELQLTDTPGLISVSLPVNAISLKVGEWYEYYLFMDIDCNSNGSRKEFAQAWVKREAIGSGFEANLERISPRERGLFYARNGFWYDAMISFAQIKDASRINSEWAQMLELIGFSEFSQISASDCCK
ncbi:MAG: DUF928 domain-containing protein [Rivularia sp. (in: cyanobacteria)]